MGEFEIGVGHFGVAASTERRMAGPPWRCSSRMSSPVVERGPGKYNINAPGSRTSGVDEAGS